MEVNIKHVSKCYQDQVVLEDISFMIGSGEICGLVGVNGAGKSTLMKILMGMTDKSKGSILIDHQEWERKYLDRMGAMIESPPLYGNLSAYDNLKVKALISSQEDARVLEVLNLVGLKNTKKRASQFSTGMKMRLGIGLAILNHPDFLILDEPTNGLDPVGIKELKDLIKDLSSSGVTVLISSHQLKDVAEVASHLVMINQGQVAYDGPCQSTQALEREFFMIVNGG